MKKLNLEELEARIAPSGWGPSDNGNSGNEVSNGSSPEPSGGGGGGSNGESNGNPGNEVSNGSSPQPK
ncbi:MAG: hypothetical protein KG003_13030 [Bacteroidetes bacterium]|nr:hypothetical protein [Bacteroidota bacterium]